MTRAKEMRDLPSAIDADSSGNVGINESSPSHKLVVGGDIGIGFNTPNDAGRQLNFNVNRGSAGQTLANINWQWNSTNVVQIRGTAGADTTNKDDGYLTFYTAAAGSLVERLRITSACKFGINYAGNPPGETIMIASADSTTGLSISHSSGGNRYGARLSTISGTNKGLIISNIFNSCLLYTSDAADE